MRNPDPGDIQAFELSGPDRVGDQEYECYVMKQHKGVGQTSYYYISIKPDFVDEGMKENLKSCHVRMSPSIFVRYGARLLCK